MPTYVAEAPFPAVVAQALPGFHAESVRTAGSGHALATQGALPARLAPAGGGEGHLRVGRGEEGSQAAFCGTRAVGVCTALGPWERGGAAAGAP